MKPEFYTGFLLGLASMFVGVVFLWFSVVRPLAEVECREVQEAACEDSPQSSEDHYRRLSHQWMDLYFDCKDLYLDCEERKND